METISEVKKMDALIIMTRIPLPGRTKTRLMDIMSGIECANLQSAFLHDLIATTERLKNDIDIYLTYTPEKYFHLLDLPQYIKSFPQSGEDLGIKMKNALETVLLKGYDRVILIGSDIPHIGAKDIIDAFAILTKKDIVLGPSYDGGYYLIGMKQINEQIFSINKSWGGQSVLKLTLNKIADEQLSVGLAKQFRDIDTKEDLFAIMSKYEHSSIVRNTAKYMKNWRLEKINVTR